MTGDRKPRRDSEPTRRVLSALLAPEGEWRYGRELQVGTSLPSGTVLPILRRLVGRGFLEVRHEDGDAGRLGRPLRTYYRLTAAGAEHARLTLEESP